MKKYPINEDTSMIYNKWVSGIAKRELQPEVITVADIINRFRNNQQPKRILPYPLSNILDFLGEIFVQCANLRGLLNQSFKNPVIKENSEKIKAVRNLNEKLDKIQNIIFSCTEELDEIVENK
jgi:hypothetical protein